jgi:hypothetical protein
VTDCEHSRLPLNLIVMAFSRFAMSVAARPSLCIGGERTKRQSPYR